MITVEPRRGHRVGVGDLSPLFHIRAQLRAGRHWSRRATRATTSHWSVTTPSLRRSWPWLSVSRLRRKSIARVVMMKCKPLLCTASVSENLSTQHLKRNMPAMAANCAVALHCGVTGVWTLGNKDCENVEAAQPRGGTEAGGACVHQKPSDRKAGKLESCSPWNGVRGCIISIISIIIV